MTLSHWPRLWRTATHLRWSQTAYRLLRQVQSRLPQEGLSTSPTLQTSDADVTPADAFSRLAESLQTSETSLGFSLRTLADLEQGNLTLLNQTLSLNSVSPDWRLGTQTSDRLWAITLHYHAWLDQLAQLACTNHEQGPQADALLRAVLADWIQRCDLLQPGSESLAWNSYAIATRLANWIRVWYRLGDAYWKQHEALATSFLNSMWRQARHLHSHLEWDLRANHLLRDAVGLAWAGTFFQGPEPARWLQKAEQIAGQQLGEQVLSDGGHFERSPMYHLEVMDDWLALATLTQNASLRAELHATWSRMAEYAAWVRHPDGTCVQFNDGAGRSVEPHLLEGHAIGLDVDLSPRTGGQHFADSGVVAWHGHPWSVFFDVGEVGPDYQPGHAHADTLTLDVSFEGRRLFVDPGTHSYDNDERRTRDRSTAAHNTVCLDDTDSSEVWHIFRVGRRARPVSTQVDINALRLSAVASHDGYEHLVGSPRHTRQVTVGNDQPLSIVDRVESSEQHTATGGWLLAPEWTSRVTDNGWLIQSGSTMLRIDLQSSQKLTTSVESCSYHPDYGMEQTTTRLCWSCRGSMPLTIQTIVDRINAAA